MVGVHSLHHGGCTLLAPWWVYASLTHWGICLSHTLRYMPTMVPVVHTQHAHHGTRGTHPACLPLHPEVYLPYMPLCTGFIGGMGPLLLARVPEVYIRSRAGITLVLSLFLRPATRSGAWGLFLLSARFTPFGKKCLLPRV